MKKILAIILSVTMFFSLPAISFAAEKNNMNSGSVHEQDVFLSDATKQSIEQLDQFGIDSDLIEKLLILSNHISFSDDQKTLKLDLNDITLIREYNFTKSQVWDLKNILKGSHYSNCNQEPLEDIYKKNYIARYYLSNKDLKAGAFAALATAASAGPAALAAAWTAMSSALAGPLGTVAGLSTAVLGGAFFADLALKITGALTKGKGVAFYLEWGLPPVRTAIE